ncbi:MAG: hypothetical protein ABIK98_11530 [Pseudomonadota bacterium]
MEELSDRLIKEFLEQTPLYVIKTFKRPRVNRSSLHINEIEEHCPYCKQSRPFQDMRSRGAGSGFAVEALKTGISAFEFNCASCRKSTISIRVEQIVTDESIALMKFGELPRKALERDPVLQKFFLEDSDNFEKATACLANGYGIAAFAYFRRIIENNIIKLLDLIRVDIQASESESGLLEAIAELKKESPMSEKIKIANKAIPTYLVPDGLNPLGRLYQVLSEGVHTFSDEECLARSSHVRECIRFLVGELATRAEHRKRFKSMIGKL